MEKKLNYFINLTFLGYFLILFAERMISIISSLVNIGIKEMYKTGYGIYSYTVVAVSLVGFLVYFLVNCRDSLKAVKNKEQIVDFKKLSIAAGIILVSGMIHTEKTIAPIQFGAYGVLIVGLLLRFIILNKTENNKVNLWLAFAYLVAFSMAIPVVYPSAMDTHVFFHISEAFASVILVAAFTYFLTSLFGEKYNNIFDYVIFIVMVVLDAALIIWRWNEEINTFVLIFASVSAAIYLARLVIKLVKKN